MRKMAEKPKRGRPKGGKKGKFTADGNAGGVKTMMGKQGEKRASMTYGRQHRQALGNGNENGGGESGSESDEDGDPDGGIGRVGMDGKAREEMKKMAAKFREVDKWGLEFEEVTGSSDRMRDAR